MLTIEKNIALPAGGATITEADKKERYKDIQTILFTFEVGDSAEFATDNINAWRVSFANARKRAGKNDLEFKIKKQNDKYRVWRVK